MSPTDVKTVKELKISGFCWLGKKTSEVVGPGGLEPPPPALSTRCSNQLSYGPRRNQFASEDPIALVEPIGIEPTTCCLQSNCSSS